MKGLVAEVPKTLGRVDILADNAGRIRGRNDLSCLGPEEFGKGMAPDHVFYGQWVKEISK